MEDSGHVRDVVYEIEGLLFVWDKIKAESKTRYLIRGSRICFYN